MTRARLATSLFAIAVAGQVEAAQVSPGEVAVAVVRGAEGVAGLTVSVDGQSIGTTDAGGRISFRTTSGLHRIVLTRGTTNVAFTEIRLGDTDAAEVAVNLPADAGDAKVERDIFNAREAAVTPIAGTVTDNSGKPLAGARVSAADTTVNTTTDASGAFKLDVPRGEYTVQVAAEGSAPQDIPGVRASPLLGGSLAVSVSAVTPAPAAVAPSTTTAGTTGSGAAALGTVTVKGVVRRQSTATKERVATSVIDAVSQEEITAAGDSNASEALQRVTGVSVQDKVVVVRGLGDRYSTTLVNGAEIPSFNPSRRVVSADAFPSDFIGSISVQKTYSADIPGDFSGGVAIIETQPVPDFQNGRVQVKAGGNSQTTFSPILTYRGSGTDYLGFDSGRRDLPKTYNEITQGGTVPIDGISQADRGKLLQSLPALFDLRRIDDAPVDFGGSLSYGDVYKFGDGRKFGFQVTGVYDTNNRFRFEDRNVFEAAGGSAVNTLVGEQLQRSEQTFETGGTLGLGYDYNKNHSINFVSLLTRQTQKGSFFSRVNVAQNGLDQERVTLDYVESQLLSNQLTGKHRFVDAGGLQLKWQLGYSTADRDVLDRRTYTRSRAQGSDDFYQFAFGGTQEGTEPRRTWEFLQDNTLDAGVDFTLPLEMTEDIRTDFKWGIRATRRDRDFESVRLGYQSLAGQRSQLFNNARFVSSLESLAIPLFFGPGGFDLVEVNSLIAQGGNANIYKANQDINAFYLMSDVFIGDDFEIQAGARVESSSIDVVTGNPALGATLNSDLKDNDVLPALNATWFITRKQQLRLGVSQSVNRPQFRELTRVEFLDPETRFLTTGNENLTSAKFTNYDLRFEQYWSSSANASIATFYKNIENPIEFNIQSTASGDPLRSFANAKKAYLYGLELDTRFGFDFLNDISTVLSHAYVAGNFSLIKSQATLSDAQAAQSTIRTRRLQGQSNYLVNTTLGYSDKASRTDAALLFNIFGDRISEVGFLGLPNAVEQSYPILDFNIRQGLWRSWLVGVKARNLLDPAIKIRQGDGLQRTYKLGVSGEISLQYQF
ncbi:TonB-dependent receptor [Nevskia ramosa]|uniref:TonB-dependent receptor n=1 Tax=Nevskia ramosa TaxID=64002 RepID=UPI002357436E|nr:TonB-dependent receptor [Nevskia ramosa]